MVNLSINDFKLGDKVVHASSVVPTMIVTEIDKDRNEITCRWMNAKKDTQSEKFIPQELIKYDSLNRSIYIPPKRRDNYY